MNNKVSFFLSIDNDDATKCVKMRKDAMKPKTAGTGKARNNRAVKVTGRVRKEEPSSGTVLKGKGAKCKKKGLGGVYSYKSSVRPVWTGMISLSEGFVWVGWV